MQLKSSEHLCTLFEGDYHYGLAALINSLYQSGFSGTIWAGYRGRLPFWAKPDATTSHQAIWWLQDRIQVVFVLLETSEHFTYIKPDFMLQLWEKHCPEAQHLIYFDPDIVIKAQWSFFEDWVQNSIALCEDVSSPLSRSHPLRKAWNTYFIERGITIESRDNVYVNGGFVGLSVQHIAFLKSWKQIQDLIRSDIPYVNHLGVLDRTFLFYKTDQDALNIAKDIAPWNISIADKNAMDFTPGGYIMSHAIGGPKPWKKNYLISLLKTGIRPSQAERLFFHFALRPIGLYKHQKFRFYLKKINLSIAIALGRFIGK